MKIRNYRYFVGDFETTVYEGQQHTEVWASACVELFYDDVHVFHSIEEQYNYFLSLNQDIICYYHNLKFDGAFWLSYLLVDLGYKQAETHTKEDLSDLVFIPQGKMKNKTLTYSISNMGQWYRIIVKDNNHIIEFRDSLKLLPFSVKKIGKSFGTKHKKLDMEYKGFRYAGCVITDEERKYIENDVLVIKEAMEIMFNEGHKKLTIGSCCLAEYKRIIGNYNYKDLFPNVYDIPLDKETYGYENAGEWIKQSYRGGWCYLVRGKENKVFHNGTTADVNSLYPSMMSSESGNRYPVGLPTFWSGNYIPEEALEAKKYFFIRIKTKFYIKDGKLPFVQVKGNMLYRPTEMLESSDIWSHRDGCYYDQYIDLDGNLQDAFITMTLTCTDFKLLIEHYDLIDLQIIDGCYFNSMCGIFDEYIQKYKTIKLQSEGAKRELAKLFLNNLYGKMASSTNSSFKVVTIKPDKSIGFIAVNADDKEPGYIPVGSAITSYARNFTIRAAQQNYYGPDKPGFIYADTDSIHCDLQPEQIKGISVHDKNFCCWKLESSWDIGYFVRQKTYIEHIVAEDLNKVESPYYNIKCAGMPDKCKTLFIHSMEQDNPDTSEMSEEEKAFISIPRNITDFKVGIRIPGKLLPKRIHGGVLLVDTTYEMR